MEVPGWLFLMIVGLISKRAGAIGWWWSSELKNENNHNLITDYIAGCTEEDKKLRENFENCTYQTGHQDI